MLNYNHNLIVILSFFATFSCCLFINLGLFSNTLDVLENLFASPIYLYKIHFTKPSENIPLVKPKNTYSIILVGDSMTQYLTDGTELKKSLRKYYKFRNFETKNYGYGSTNILSLEDRLNKETQNFGIENPPILKQEFDILILESFGHNPLSDFSLEDGLKKHTDALDQALKQIKSSHPSSVILFLATISPNKNRYGEGAVNLLPEARQIWSAERIAYIKNHIKYARDKNLPLVNVYEKSLNESGDGNIDYIDTKDFIHPSPTGIKLISEEIAKYIYEQRLLPL